MKVTDVSPVVQDYLKAIWQAREWGGAPATTSSLATHFGTSQANVSDTLRRLDEQGLVKRKKYRPVELTRRGEELAVAMVRRHRLIETFLVSQLGYACTEVHADAELLEHAASEVFLERLDELLGHPSADPHGDPIPDAKGRVTYPDALPLKDAPAGEYLVVRVSDEDESVLGTLHGIGVHAGSLLRLGEPAISRSADVTGPRGRPLGVHQLDEATQEALLVRSP